MFELSVQREFCAAHALMFRGQREPTHGHNFRLTVTLAGPTLDPDGVLVDFHALEALIDSVIKPYHNQDLNRVAPFDQAGGINPSAELIAQHICGRLEEGLTRIGGHSSRIASVSITEAPGCVATYRPSAGPTAAGRPMDR
ncbi:MAG: 6-carboxytetrahydropterin synthase [Phycisphaerales bacterium]|nr:6-carboxytetrahydropterin synthase [Phycisphaerales bacterium]